MVEWDVESEALGAVISPPAFRLCAMRREPSRNQASRLLDGHDDFFVVVLELVLAWHP